MAWQTLWSMVGGFMADDWVSSLTVDYSVCKLAFFFKKMDCSVSESLYSNGAVERVKLNN